MRALGVLGVGEQPFEPSWRIIRAAATADDAGRIADGGEKKLIGELAVLELERRRNEATLYERRLHAHSVNQSASRV